MSRQLLIAEGLVIAAGLIIVFLIVGSPFGSSGDSGPGSIVGDNTRTPSPSSSQSPGVSDAPANPTPGDHCAPAVSADFMRGNQILTYYGNPDAETLGILGQHPPEELVDMLNQEAKVYDEANSLRGIQTGFHFIYSTAQFAPGEDGHYTRHTDSDTVDEYVRIACEHGMFIFLDLQIGQADLETEIRNVLPWLEETHVHLSLDPEFAMQPGEVPGEVIGHLTAEQINQAQQILEDLVEEHNLPDKILIVHQFQESMIENPELIQEFSRVRLIIDMDGFGPAATKLRKYQQFAAPAEYGGIKIFFKQDEQPILTPEEVLRLHPDLIIFQ